MSKNLIYVFKIKLDTLENSQEYSTSGSIHCWLFQRKTHKRHFFSNMFPFVFQKKQLNDWWSVHGTLDKHSFSKAQKRKKNFWLVRIQSLRLLSRLELWNTPTAPLQRGMTPLTSVLDMTLNNLMVKFQWCWGFGICGAPHHWHSS